jgi:hypothetical protein
MRARRGPKKKKDKQTIYRSFCGAAIIEEADCHRQPLILSVRMDVSAEGQDDILTAEYGVPVPSGRGTAFGEA